MCFVGNEEGSLFLIAAYTEGALTTQTTVSSSAPSSKSSASKLAVLSLY